MNFEDCFKDFHPLEDKISNNSAISALLLNKVVGKARAFLVNKSIDDIYNTRFHFASIVNEYIKRDKKIIPSSISSLELPSFVESLSNDVNIFKLMYEAHYYSWFHGDKKKGTNFNPTNWTHVELFALLALCKAGTAISHIKQNRGILSSLLPISSQTINLSVGRLAVEAMDAISFAEKIFEGEYLLDKIFETDIKLKEKRKKLEKEIKREISNHANKARHGWRNELYSFVKQKFLEEYSLTSYKSLSAFATYIHPLVLVKSGNFFQSTGDRGYRTVYNWVLKIHKTNESPNKF